MAALDNIGANRLLGERRDGGDADRKMLRDLENMIGKQQQLLDETFRRAQGGEQPGGIGDNQRPGQGSGSRGMVGGEFRPGLSQQQSLRAGLNELMRRWGGRGRSIRLPRNRASRAMREGLRAVSAGGAGQRGGAQTSATEEMQRGGGSSLDTTVWGWGGGRFRVWFVPAPGGGEVGVQVFVCRHTGVAVAKSNEHDAVRWVRIAAAADIRGLMPGLDTVLHELAARFTEAAAAG